MSAAAHTDTQAVEVEARTSRVVDVMSDAGQLPRWADAFVDVVERTDQLVSAGHAPPGPS